MKSHPLNQGVRSFKTQNLLSCCKERYRATISFVYLIEGEKLKVEGTSQVKASSELVQNNDLLGFALCSVHVPPDKESEDGLDDNGTWSLKCELTIEDGHQFKVVVPLSFQCWCDCDIGDDVSSQVWVTYYPRITFPSKYASNKRRAFLKAAFQGYFNGEPVKVENCGIHLIYAHEQEPSR
ncbi:hypothetical protein AAG906_000513 [Vitis piasezkii]